MISSVVIIDDDPIVNEMLVGIATTELRFPYETYFSAEQFMASPKQRQNCVYLVDWTLPGLQGTDLIKDIRKSDKISPIFMISGNFDKEFVLEGLKSGADDYLIKPFEPAELVTKIKNASQRNDCIFENMMNYGIKLIPEANLVIKDGRKQSLTTREFQVFKVLYDHPTVVHSRSSIVAMFDDIETTERNIDVLVFNLRKKLQRIGIEVQTIRGQGYQLGQTDA